MDYDINKSDVKSFDISEAFIDEIREVLETPQTRAAFVHNIGILLSQTRENIVGLNYYVDTKNGVELAEIEYRGGHKVPVNIHCDSWLAALRDIVSAIEL